jgi:signal transduction histidine kinase
VIAGLIRAAAYVRRQVEGAHAQMQYPWWIVAWSVVAMLSCTVVAVAQRDALIPPGWYALAILAVAFPMLPEVALGRISPPALNAVIACGTVAVLLRTHVQYDFAPLVLALVVGEVASLSRVRISLGALGLAIVTVVGLGVGGGILWMYLVTIVAGWEIGFAMQWQLRLLQSERRRHAAQQTEAATAERQRIAREIHDVVAHSLSVTMLHVTGARRMLQTDRDVDEAVDALQDAERVGRQALAEIRRTVGLLGASGSGTRVLPGVADIADLVGTVRAAGVTVEYSPAGDLARVDPTVGLGLYRIAQESLTNVTKHAPGHGAIVCLHVTTTTARLEISNGTAGPVQPNGRTGSGVRGMHDRVEQLGGRLAAGPDECGWRVAAVIPLNGTT